MMTKQTGFTLVEAMVATGLVFVLLITLVGLASLSIKSAQISRAQGEATKFAQSEMELLRAYRDKNGLASLRCILTSPTQSPGAAPTATPAPTGLLDWWKVDELSGNQLLDSINSVTGTATGSTIVTGQINRARQFNGNSEYVTFSPSAALDQLGGAAKPDFTVSAWVNVSNLPDIPNEDLYPIVMKLGSPSESSRYWLIGAHRATSNTTGYFSFRLYDGGSISYSINSPVQTITNGWVLVTAVKAAGNAKLYLDGQLSSPSTTVPVSNYSNTAPLKLAEAGSWGFYSGSIDEVRVYDRALTALEVQALFDQATINPTVVPTPPLGVGCHVNADLTAVVSGPESVPAGVPGITFYRYYQTQDSPDCVTTGSGNKIITTVYVTWTDAKGTHKSKLSSCLTDWQL